MQYGHIVDIDLKEGSTPRTFAFVEVSSNCTNLHRFSIMNAFFFFNGLYSSFPKLSFCSMKILLMLKMQFTSQMGASLIVIAYELETLWLVTFIYSSLLNFFFYIFNVFLMHDLWF